MFLFLLLTTSLGFRFQNIRFRGEMDRSDVIEHVSTQPIDHFDLTNKKTINIRYFINDTIYSKEAPLLVDLGGEGTQRAAAVGGRFVINKYAEKYNSLMLAIEHRFYGKSVPEGGLSQENLGYLSAAQALEDYIMIINQIKKEYQITGPVIVFGGSYSGNLATWIRQKYPNVVYAAVASSAPVYATSTFYEFLDVIYNDMGEKCGNAWKEATDSIEELFKTDSGKAQLKNDFKTCTEIKEEDDLTILIQQIQATMVNYPQYNGSYSLTIEGVCNILTTEGKTAYENMVDLMSHAFNEFGFECAPSSYADMLTDMANTKTEEEGNRLASTRSWAWQICSEYSYFQPVNESLPFSKRLNNEFYYLLCKDIFNVDKQRLDRRVYHTNLMYGGYKPKATNVAYTSGSTDPWSPLAKHETLPSDINCYASYIKGTAHCADLYAEKDTDPEQLKQQRMETAQFIDELISRYNN
ncbi:serine carboxypeptidase (S28) family protein [Entamoeba histolytica HM-3:IMSS]|uniref:Serine carboxypeptidase (S28) family protein n=5 Tax=Entamoeba histolytica TaxID=5759 RepID=C4M2I4_ENTH1|nr:serine carboxypeptidase (S28) family protein [Entamoeba histolytica HM-1:IMSS]EAL46703.1 serine carboxypeptidase (S28) family protein [Entamoeba histolytica HM-1:IMSS]EMS17786.1 serine carboxypeptidase (S28) family protein [Entamoeba histolytica HM-3:IMSS]ENY60442.1 serine carboxypeptidase (S28) family protein, putative [Entamoeba histolytica HM-1:IMSS-A]GAT95487.1 serine carboxypeptidase s28 family protein [Entamoeba histolytica]|eukprot:XP_652089.1 serine carboxypeptidase (S28) family protein [Entamoeba histolytica HM-1:IMSS]